MRASKKIDSSALPLVEENPAKKKSVKTDKNKKIANEHANPTVNSSCGSIGNSTCNTKCETEKVSEKSRTIISRKRSKSSKIAEQYNNIDERIETDAKAARKTVRPAEENRNDDSAKAKPAPRKKSNSGTATKSTKGIRKNNKFAPVDDTANGPVIKKAPKQVKRRKDTRADSAKIMAPVQYSGDVFPVKDCFDLVEIILDGKPIQVSATSLRDGYYCQGLDSTFIIHHYFPKGRPKVFPKGDLKNLSTDK